MTSQRKIEANRRNSLRSTGPRTAAGKKIASRNAVKHNLWGASYLDSPTSPESERLAAQMCAGTVDPELHQAALQVIKQATVQRAVALQKAIWTDKLANSAVAMSADSDKPNRQDPSRVLEGMVRYQNRAAAQERRTLRNFTRVTSGTNQ
jgi:hypothetical protein